MPFESRSGNGAFRLDGEGQGGGVLRDEVSRAVAEEHEHGQELLGLVRVVVQTLHEELEAPLRTQLTDERPQLMQQVIQVGQAWGNTKRAQ